MMMVKRRREPTLQELVTKLWHRKTSVIHYETLQELKQTPLTGKCTCIFKIINFVKPTQGSTVYFSHSSSLLCSIYVMLKKSNNIKIIKEANCFNTVTWTKTFLTVMYYCILLLMVITYNVLLLKYISCST